MAKMKMDPNADTQDLKASEAIIMLSEYGTTGIAQARERQLGLPNGGALVAQLDLAVERLPKKNGLNNSTRSTIPTFKPSFLER